MTTISCPRCETTFESQATTATRCRECRSVVHVGGRATERRARSPRRASTIWSEEEPDGEETTTGIAIAVILVVTAIGVGVYLYVRARRRRKAGEVRENPTPLSAIPEVPS